MTKNHTSCPCEDCRKIVLGTIGAGVMLLLFILMTFGSMTDDDMANALNTACASKLGGELKDVQFSENGFFVSCEKRAYGADFYILNVTRVSS